MNQGQKGTYMARQTLLITYIATYLLAVGGITRILVRFRDDPLWSIAILSGVYLVLLILEPFLIRQNRLLTYIYLIIQTAIIATLSLLTPNSDFWAALFCPLVVQVMHNFPQRTGFLITGIFTVITSILLLLSLDSEVGIPLIFVYAVIYFLLAAYIAIIREAEAARQQGQQQQAELQSAYQQLQTYTAQAEELAVLQERNRLARELHDSVTQSLHSSTLLAEAGQRVASAGDIERARGYLIRLGEISQQALREMRLLVYELRPLALREIGLVEALQQRMDTVERRAGIEATLRADDTLDLPRSIEEEIYRIAIEALNNALKHANPTTVTVTLGLLQKPKIPCVELTIVDDGIGFDPDMKGHAGGLGLVSMQERIEKLGGELTILSAPGKGTQVKACVNLKTPTQSPSV
jgi:signal transduction histidine kinase